MRKGRAELARGGAKRAEHLLLAASTVLCRSPAELVRGGRPASEPASDDSIARVAGRWALHVLANRLTTELALKVPQRLEHARARPLVRIPIDVEPRGAERVVPGAEQRRGDLGRGLGASLPAPFADRGRASAATRFAAQRLDDALACPRAAVMRNLEARRAQTVVPASEVA